MGDEQLIVPISVVLEFGRAAVTHRSSVAVATDPIARMTAAGAEVLTSEFDAAPYYSTAAARRIFAARMKHHASARW